MLLCDVLNPLLNVGRQYILFDCVLENIANISNINLTSTFGPNFSVMELVDAAIPAQHLEPIKQTILQTEGVKVSSEWGFLAIYCSRYTVARELVDIPQSLTLIFFICGVSACVV